MILVAMPSPASAHKAGFQTVLKMIEAARARAFHAVNTESIDLYWRLRHCKKPSLRPKSLP